MGAKPDPEKDDIRVDGQPISKQEKHKPLYIMLNKPLGYTSTVSDPHAERTVLDLLLQVEERIYPVGRLDVDSEGMLLLTNDGEFANRLTHPRYHVPKLYRVRARGFVSRGAATRLAEGVELEDGVSAPAEVQFIEYDNTTQSTIIEITMYEGRNRQVRRMFDQVGHPVRQLTRIGFGSLRLQNLNPGTWRKLRPEEVDALLALAKPTATPPKSARKPKSTAPFRPRNAGSLEEEKRRRGVEERGGAEDGGRTPEAGRPTFMKAAPEEKAEFGIRKTEDRKPPVSKVAPDEDTAHGSKFVPISRPVFAPESAPPAKLPFNGKPVRPAGKSRGGVPMSADEKRSVYGNRPTGGKRPPARPAFGTSRSPETGPVFAVGNPRFTDPMNNPLLKARPAKFTPSKPASEAGTSEKDKRGKGKGKGGKSIQKRGTLNPQLGRPPVGKDTTQNPTGAVDFSSNSAAGRKAGLPFQPRPKQGHRAFGRAKP